MLIKPFLQRKSPGARLGHEEVNALEELGQRTLVISAEEAEEAPASEGAQIGYFRFKSMADNYFMAAQFDPTTGVEQPTQVRIAKHDALRNVASRGTATFIYISFTERIQSKPSIANETQIVTEEFLLNDEIRAIEGPTPVFVEVDPGPPPVLEQVTWEDLNSAARQWARKFGT